MLSLKFAHNCFVFSDQFKCISGVSRVPCLYKWERCDGIQDCSDGSDEILCGKHIFCTCFFIFHFHIHCNTIFRLGSDVLKCYGNFMCDDGSCVSLAKVCNGVFDCKDGSDEMKCGKSINKIGLITKRNLSRKMINVFCRQFYVPIL